MKGEIAYCYKALLGLRNQVEGICDTIHDVSRRFSVAYIDYTEGNDMLDNDERSVLQYAYETTTTLKEAAERLSEAIETAVNAQREAYDMIGGYDA